MFRSAPFAVGGRERAGKIFECIDADGNDSVSLGELARSQHSRNARILDPETARKFHELDKNHDGTVGRLEFANSRAAEFARKAGKSPKEVTVMFERMDLNDSGVLGPFEFLQAQPDRRKHLMDAELAKKFAALDDDDGGTVSRGEYADSPFAEHARKTGNLKGVSVMFNKIDQNGNGEIGPREYAQFQESLSDQKFDSDSREMFAELDWNRDGVISRREYSRSPFAKSADDRKRVDSVFARIDSDGDGELNLKEYAARFSSGAFGPPRRMPPPAKKD